MTLQKQKLNTSPIPVLTDIRLFDDIYITKIPVLVSENDANPSDLTSEVASGAISVQRHAFLTIGKSSLFCTQWDPADVCRN